MNKSEFSKKLRDLINSGDNISLADFCTKYKRNIIPDKLYKYAPFSCYAVDNLLNSQLYLNSPRNFNDPFDCWYFKSQSTRSIMLDIIQKAMDICADDASLETFLKQTSSQAQENKKITDEDIDKLIDNLKRGIESSKRGNSHYDIVNKALERVRIVCLSEYHPSNLLMWSHYADYHKGLCFEYDFRNCNSTTLDMLYPVIYQEQSKVSTVKYNKNSPEDFQSRELLKTVLFKSWEWIYEQEWRLIDIQREANDNGITHKIPLPTRIYIGVYANDEDKINAILNFACLNGISVSKMSRNDDSFLLSDNSI